MGQLRHKQSKSRWNCSTALVACVAMNGMAKTFKPKLEILPAEQRRLWDALGQVPEGMVLYGGTALALQLGHRLSVDFDFFTNKPIDTEELLKLPMLEGCEVLMVDENSLTANTKGPEAVKMSFFSVPDIGKTDEPLIAEGTKLRVAPLLDLAATKVKVIQDRAEPKDYIDLYELIAGGYVTLEGALDAAVKIYGDDFHVGGSLLALQHYEEGKLPELDIKVRERLTDEAQALSRTMRERQRKGRKK